MRVTMAADFHVWRGTSLWLWLLWLNVRKLSAEWNHTRQRISGTVVQGLHEARIATVVVVECRQ